jgi:hypothetical protein
MERIGRDQVTLEVLFTEVTEPIDMLDVEMSSITVKVEDEVELKSLARSFVTIQPKLGREWLCDKEGL